MKRREVRPEPTKISTYFFDQILYEAEREAKAQGAIADTTTPSPPSYTFVVPPGLGGPLVKGNPDEAAELSSSWCIAPVTRHRRIDERLWDSFTPITYKDELVEFVSVEHGRTRALAQELQAMWEQVEALMERNAVRQAALKDDHKKQLEALQRTVFWTAEDVLQRYKLDLTLPTQLLRVKGGGADKPCAAQGEDNSASSSSNASLFQQMTPEAHIQLHFDMNEANRSCESSTGTSAGGSAAELPISRNSSKVGEALSSTQPGLGKPEAIRQTTARKAKAYTKSKEELLDPTQRPHCLRRLFAPLLQRRDQLPKNLTVMFAEIQKCQTEVLPKLEESLANCSMFQIPLHVPFQMIAQYITRYLTSEMPTLPLEEQQKNKDMAAMRKQVAELKDFILEEGRSEAALDRLPVRERHDLAQTMWQKLLAELRTHRELHHKYLQHYEAMTDCSSTALTKLKAALDDCDRCSAQALEQLVNDAKESISVIQNMAEKIKDVVREVESAFGRDRTILEASLASKEYKMEKSAALQERLARRVREAVKEYFAEQMNYEELSQEVYQERLALAQVTTSYDQVKHAVKTCYEEAIASDARAVKIQKMLKKSERVRAHMVTACRQHVGRLETDDLYRRHRIADNCAANMLEWSRCLGDIVAVYQDRFEGISSKGKVSWQMDYLVAGERAWAVDNFTEGREELIKLDQRMDEIKRLYRELDDELPPLVPGYSSETEAVRTSMRNIDGPLNVQRQLPHLNEKAPAGSTKQRIAAVMNATSVGDPDALAGGPLNAAGRDGPVPDLDHRVRDRIPLAPQVTERGDGGGAPSGKPPTCRDASGERSGGLPPLSEGTPMTAEID
eukprot:gene10745-7473_t